MSNIHNICIFNLSLHSSSSPSSSSECEKWNHAVRSIMRNHWLSGSSCRHSAIAINCFFRFNTLRLTKGKLQSHCHTFWHNMDIKNSYITYKPFIECLVILPSKNVLARSCKKRSFFLHPCKILQDLARSCSGARKKDLFLQDLVRAFYWVDSCECSPCCD